VKEEIFILLSMGFVYVGLIVLTVWIGVKL